MELDRAKIVDENFIRRVAAQDFPSPKSNTTPSDANLDKNAFLDLFDSQLISRHLDLLARDLHRQQKGFYTIGSSGHEGNAAIAKAFQTDDMAFLHYRSGAFMAQRAKSAEGIDYAYDKALALVASSEDPISGGRHKVFGSLKLSVPPQTSTIASHLPKAVGSALALTLAKKTHRVILCSFGDASVNHSTAQGAINTVQWLTHAHLPLPLVLICEDNGWGISVPTPPDWIEKTMGNRAGIHYLACDGRNLCDVYIQSRTAERLARKKEEPVFLHMKTVRLLGHAGSDIEFQYRSEKDIEISEADDPLLHSARILIAEGWATPEQILHHYESVRINVRQAADRATARPKLQSAEEIMASIVPPRRDTPVPDLPTSKTFAQTEGRNMAQCINMALTDLMLQYPQLILFGEDVGKKGGVYRVTADLQARFGKGRVFDTLLDEQTILGTAMGLAQQGFIPVPEIQFLAYTHNACDQIRGEAATLSFFSKGQYTNPMVIRIAGLGYQKGFGGHFHNDNAIAFLREIPGLIIACPSAATDAALLIRECVRLAYQEQRVVVFLEPIALYMNKEMLGAYPDPRQSLPFGELGITGDKQSETVIISYGNGMHLSRQAADALLKEHQIAVKLIDLRWLAPINKKALYQEIAGKKSVIIVDECRRTGSLSEELITGMVENCQPLPRIKRITGEDTFIPLGKAWEYVLPTKAQIMDAVLSVQAKG